MRVLLLLFLAALPVMVICWLIYRKDKNKEPTNVLINLFWHGIMSCFLVLIVSSILEVIFPVLQKETYEMNIFEIAFYAFVGVALVEECCKWVYLNKHGYNNNAFDEKYDIIVYSVFVSLGFAFFENILYVFMNNSVSVALLRAVLAVPGHACDAIFMGYYLTLAKQAKLQGNAENERKNKIKSILVPTLLHGVYDFCLFTQEDLFLLIFVVFVIVLYILSIMKIKKLAATNSNYYYRTNTDVYRGYNQVAQENNYNNMLQQTSYQQAQVQKEFCTNCGAIMIGPFCAQCGKRK